MTERGQRSVQREARRFTVGPSSVRWERDALVLDLDEISVPIPRRIRGKVRVMPTALSTFVTPLDAGGRHRWGPIAPCARVEVALEHPAQRWSGHGYLDSNEGEEPIDRPFREWDWSRSNLRDGSTAVLYDVQPKSGPDRVLALRFDRQGGVQTFEPPPRQTLPATLWRVPRRMRSDGAAVVQVEQTLEDAPFYSRAVLRSSLLGETVTSVHETLNVPRLVATSTQWMLPWRMPRRA